VLRTILCMAALTLAGCNKSTLMSPPISDADVEITSTAFAILPCAGHDAAMPCALVRAGGKRVLMGAPAGVSQSLSTEDLRQLDAVMLFSLRAADLEGLDEIRNASWLAGRSEPLPVSGPGGTAKVLAALNAVFEISDARHFLTKSMPGGYDAPLLRAVPGESDTKTQVFSTGDLIITHLVNADGLTGYWVDYDGVRAVIEPCGMTQAAQFGGENKALIACAPTENATATWPLLTRLTVDTRKPVRGAKALTGSQAP
jgi:hypothetical protein